MGVPKHTQVIGFLNSQEGLVLQILKPVFFFFFNYPIQCGHVFVSSQVSFCFLTVEGPLIWLGEGGSVPSSCMFVWWAGFPSPTDVSDLPV